MAEAVGICHPQFSGCVRSNCVDPIDPTGITGNRLPMVMEAAACRVEPNEAARFSCNPEYSRSIFIDRVESPVFSLVRPVHADVKCRERECPGVKSIQDVIVGS